MASPGSPSPVALGPVFQDQSLYEAFRWTTTDKVLLKQVNRHVKQLMAASINRHSSSVNCNGVLFVDHGVVVPSKKARTFAAAYGW